MARRSSAGLGRLAVAGVPLVLVPALGATQGGFQPDAWVWSGALAAWAAALGLVLSNDPGGVERARWWLLATAALLLWTVLSALWSVHAAQSLLEARRTVLYAAGVLALVVLARGDATRILVGAAHVGISGLLVYALGRHLLGHRHNILFEGYHLTEPLGYANAVGILATLGALLGLGIAATAERRPVRGGAAATVPLLLLALGLTGSDASWLALGIGVATIVLLEPDPLPVVRCLGATAPACALLLWLASHTGLDAFSSTPSRRTGVLVALAAGGCAAATGIAVAWLRPAKRAAGRQGARRLLIAAVACAAVGGAVAVAHAGATQPRASYWHVAWHDELGSRPVLGSGAGTFARYWQSSGRELRYGGALDAHSLYLETLAELGPVGLALLAAMLLIPLRGVVACRRVAYVPPAAGAYVAFLLHAGLDWDWEVPAVVVAGLACAAAVLLARREPPAPLGRRTRLVLLLAALALGAAAIAGARSHTVPAALHAEAPQRGAS